MSTRWEYHILNMPTNLWGSVNEKKLAEQFAQLGRQGWELVGIHTSALSNKPVAVLKRTAA